MIDPVIPQKFQILNSDGNVIDNFGGGGAGAWGDITGTLSDQTDLQTALDGKVDKVTGPLLTPFVVSKTGMDMKSTGSGATLFTISLPGGASGIKAIMAWFEITTVTAGGAAAFRFNLAGNNGIMTGSTASASSAPVAGQQWESLAPANTSPTFKATTGDVTVTISTGFTGTTVTGTLFALLMYVP